MGGRGKCASQTQRAILQWKGVTSVSFVGVFGSPLLRPQTNFVLLQGVFGSSRRVLLGFACVRSFWHWYRYDKNFGQGVEKGRGGRHVF